MDEQVEKPSERDRGSQTPDKPIKILIDTFGRENVFVELQRHFIRGEERVNRELIRSGRRISISAPRNKRGEIREALRHAKCWMFLPVFGNTHIWMLPENC